MRGFTRKYAQKEGAEQIIAAVGKQGGARVGDVVQVTDNAFKKGYNVLLKDAWKIANSKSYKNIAKHSQVHMQKLSDDFAENLLNIGIATNKKQANLVSNKFISEAMYQSQNSMHTFTTHFARSLLGSMDKAAFKTGGKFSKLLLGPDSEIYTSQILGAMGFDAAIGLVIGTMRSAADQVWKINYGVERDHHTRMLGYSEDGPNYNFNLGDASKAWALESLKESLIFSVIGPVKFFGNIGGKAYTPQGSHSKRLASYIGNTTKAYWKPLNRYTGTELKAQITAMDEISGGFLNSKISSKFSKMG